MADRQQVHRAAPASHGGTDRDPLGKVREDPRLLGDIHLPLRAQLGYAFLFFPLAPETVSVALVSAGQTL